MDLKQVENLIELMIESGVTQLTLELPDFKISISRGAETSEVTPLDNKMTPEEMLIETPLHVEVQEALDIKETGLPVVSPVVGLFHNGGMLDPREAVQEGDLVSEGQLLAAIEAMKVPNELRAPVSGRVKRLLVEDGAPVEYGQALFIIEPEQVGETNDGEPPIGLA